MKIRLNDLLQSRWTGPAAAALGFLEGSVIPLPMEPIFIPLMASEKRGAWLIAAYLVIGNVLGAVLVYWLAVWMYEPVLQPAIASLGMDADFRQASDDLREDGFTALFLAGVTPFPFQLGTAAAGIVSYPLWKFVIAVMLSRGVRYFGLAALVIAVGLRAEEFIERNKATILAVGLILFVLVSALTLIV